MRTSSTWNRAIYIVAPVAAILMFAVVHFADPPADGRLKVLTMGLGSGRITSSPSGIDCTGTCEAVFPATPNVQLTATPAAGSVFVGWAVDPDAEPLTTPDCSSTTNPCVLTMNAHRSVRPVFGLATAVTPIPIFDTATSAPSTRVLGPGDVLAQNEIIRPEDLDTYVRARTDLTPARFIAALPPEFKLNWIMMTRSESLQTGTSQSPRILLPSADGRFVFTIGMRTHSSYPGASPNAIEFMQWDAAQKNFRFHEVIIQDIPLMDADGDGVGVIPARPRAVRIDDDKCPKCHSTRNVLNPGTTLGTDGIPPRTIKVKNKPNWDAYDSWGGMLSFNRDRIYQGSVEAAAFRKLLDPWTWSTNDSVRQIIEQLKLQPPGTPSPHLITRFSGGPNDGHIRFGFDPAPSSGPVLTEPAPSSSGTGDEVPINTSYSFDRLAGTGTGTSVVRGGTFITIHHSTIPTSDEGRGVHLFDLLTGFGSPVPGDTATSNLNSQRIADEVINHRFATGNVPIEVRPVALAIAKRCFNITSSGVTSASGFPAHTINTAFFDARNGMTANNLLIDTRKRAESLPLRKAGIQRFDLHRTATGADNDIYTTGSDPIGGLLQVYPASPSATPDFTLLRQEVFRRPTRARPCPILLCPDNTVMNGIYVDRELYDANTEHMALYRYFLEPLGVSVDKWSTGVRGRSRTYTFADVFDIFENTLIGQIEASLRAPTATTPDARPIPGLTSFECGDLIPFISAQYSSAASTTLPDVNAVPTYTDIQRIFNKSCIECHGGLDYPPYQNYGSTVDLSENENPPAGQDRLDRSHALITPFMTTDPNSSFVYNRVTDFGNLTHPYNPPTGANEACPFGLMPCAGPPLSKVDIETLRRYIVGSSPNTRGDPHIETVDGTPYDFQGAGEFVLLRGQGLEIQARQVGVDTNGPLGPNDHTGLTSCVSINTAAAVRVGPHRITYLPNLNGQPDPEGMQLRIDGKLTTLSSEVLLPAGGRVMRTTAPGGVQIEAPGGTVVILTPNFWPTYQIWFLDIDTQNARATDGVMGAIAAGSWLPSMPDGSSLGPRPRDLHQRYLDLYAKFANAWRVTDATSLFDYAPGTSTASFTIASWPEENPQSCVVRQRVPGGPIEKPPLKTLSLEAAQEQCRAIVAANARANCVQDVMVTGEPKFAETYLRGEQIARNGRPDTPVLLFPDRFKTDVSAAIDFQWNKTTDKDGDPVSYKHCVWEVNEPFTLNKCVATATATTTGTGTGGLMRSRFSYPLLVLLAGILLLILLFFLGLRRRPWVLAVVALVIVAAMIAVFYVRRPNPSMLAKNVSGLQSGKAYYWKVIAEDNKGGTTESETRRFEVK